MTPCLPVCIPWHPSWINLQCPPCIPYQQTGQVWLTTDESNTSANDERTAYTLENLKLSHTSGLSIGWTPEEDLPLGEGYYMIHPDEENDNWVPVDFNFEALQWGTTCEKSNSQFEISRLASINYRLWIFDEERVWDRSWWGPINRPTDPEEETTFKFGSEGGDTPDQEADVQISTMDKDKRVEMALADLTGLIPSHFDKPSTSITCGNNGSNHCNHDCNKRHH